MNDYDTRNERGTLETDFDQLPGETSTVGEESTVVSVRLRGAELATVEQVRNPARRSRRPRMDNHDYLRSLGATPVEYGPRLLTQVAQVAPQGIDKALDGGGRGFVDQVLTILPPEQIITIADFSAIGKGVQLANGDPLALYADSFREQITLAAQDRFATQIAAEFTFEDLPAAHTMSEAGHLRGKILVRVADLDAETSSANTRSGSDS